MAVTILNPRKQAGAGFEPGITWARIHQIILKNILCPCILTLLEIFYNLSISVLLGLLYPIFIMALTILNPRKQAGAGFEPGITWAHIHQTILKNILCLFL